MLKLMLSKHTFGPLVCDSKEIKVSFYAISSSPRWAAVLGTHVVDPSGKDFQLLLFETRSCKLKCGIVFKQEEKIVDLIFSRSETKLLIVCSDRIKIFNVSSKGFLSYLEDICFPSTLKLAHCTETIACLKKSDPAAEDIQVRGVHPSEVLCEISSAYPKEICSDDSLTKVIFRHFPTNEIFVLCLKSRQRFSLTTAERLCDPFVTASNRHLVYRDETDLVFFDLKQNRKVCSFSSEDKLFQSTGTTHSFIQSFTDFSKSKDSCSIITYKVRQRLCVLTGGFAKAIVRFTNCNKKHSKVRFNDESTFEFIIKPKKSSRQLSMVDSKESK